MPPSYHPASRRPIAEIFRWTARLATQFCVKTRIHPDSISYASIAAAGLAAFSFWQSKGVPSLLLIAPLFCYVRLWLNMLDGMVAIAAQKASWRGEILNDLPDRISDIVIFAGVAHSGWCHPGLAYWVVILALLTAYVGVFGQALGGGRQFGGVMSKPWRMVALHIGSWIAFALYFRNGFHVALGSLQILDWTCLVIIAGCLQTIVVRLKRIMVAVRERE